MHRLVTESISPSQPMLEAEAKTPPSGHTQEGSSTLPFGRHLPYSAIRGPTYVTAQVLIQQTALALSHRLYTYSPEGFDLDLSLQEWSRNGHVDPHGHLPGLIVMQDRPGAGTVALGYLFSADFDPSRRHAPQSLIGAVSSLRYLRSALDEFLRSTTVAIPLAIHIAAADYVGGSVSSLVSDYASALAVADELGLALVCSSSTHESQHMALFSTILSNVLPTIHLYDGVAASRETTRVIDVLDGTGLRQAYRSVTQELYTSNDRRRSPEAKLSRLLLAFNGELGTAYGLFEYQGHQAATHVLVVLGTLESSLSAPIARSLAEDGHRVGVLSVRVYRPFADEEFLRALPSSTQAVTVLGQVHEMCHLKDDATHSLLYNDVLAAVALSQCPHAPPRVFDLKYPREQIWTPAGIFPILSRLGNRMLAPSPSSADSTQLDLKNSRILSATTVKQYIFWDIGRSPSIQAPSILAELLAQDSSQNLTFSRSYDDVVHGGVQRADIRTSKRSIEVSYPIDEANISYVGDVDLFKDIDVLASLRPNGTLLVRIPNFQEADIEYKMPGRVRKGLAAKRISFYVVDPQASPASRETPGLERSLIPLVFLKLARPELLLLPPRRTGLDKLVASDGNDMIPEGVASTLTDTLRGIIVPESWAALETDAGNFLVAPPDIRPTSFSTVEREPPSPPSPLRGWQPVAKGLMFKEAFGTKLTLRPELSVKTWRIRVKENRRLTPITYERNIFHIEFDLGDSGLRYEIGQALGIHAENDGSEVDAFIRQYGLDPDAIVEVPSREDADVLETKTVYQSLMQNVDIFGRPPKKFYEALAEFTQDEQERKALLALASPLGATEFKRRAEVDTVTFADILFEFPTAHPSFHDIVRIVSPMKRREYSIASSQKVNPDSVALLVVTVDWVDPGGRDRFGQATRYLNRLKVGDAVTVSVKPSVMTLPTQSTQPLIMAGLGTGLAPFRAFVQHRAWQKSQGMEIGAVLLYMGSRHQREEYLYGEEWEAYQAAGVITLLGRAFSRDQPQKIYIQDRMRQTMADIIEAYLTNTGSFYLCGPTWPVPDVTRVLQEAISLDARTTGRKVDSRREIERLKDESRYVLEGRHLYSRAAPFTFPPLPLHSPREVQSTLT